MEVPVSPTDLDKIVYNVARDLIEERAINGTFEEMSDKEVDYIVNDVIFIIDRYMYYVNELFDTQKLDKANEIFKSQTDFE